jgi:uncharacterized phage-associated protein
MPVSARDVAAALRERQPGLGKVQLQKLLYYAQGHHLATFGTPLFSDTIMAWDMGPVVPAVWKDEQIDDPWLAETVPPKLGEAELNTVGYVLSRYGNLSGTDLINLTHSEEPWQIANRHRRPGEGVRMDLDDIVEYFTKRANEEDEDGIVLDSDEVRKLLDGAEERRKTPLREDDLDELRAKLAAARGH